MPLRRIETDEAITKFFSVKLYAEDSTADVWCKHLSEETGEECAYGRNVDVEEDGTIEKAVRNALLAHAKQGHGGGKMRKARSAS